MYKDHPTALVQFALFWFAFSIFLSNSFANLYVPASLYISIGILSFFLCNLLKGDYNLRIGTKTTLLLTVFLLVLFFGVFYSHAPTYGETKASLLAFWLCYFVLAGKYLVRHLEWFFRFCILFGAIFLILTVVYFGDPLNYFNEIRMSSSRLGLIDDEFEVINPIWFARYLGLLFLIGFFRFPFQWKTTQKILLGLLMIYMVFSGSKGPLISLGIAISAMYFLEGKYKKILSYAVILLLLIGCLFYFDFFQIDFFYSRFIDSGSAASRDNITYRTFAELPFASSSSLLFGNGTGNSGYLLSGHDTREYPHNLFMEVFHENGILGVVLLLLLIVDCGYSMWKSGTPQGLFIFSIWVYYLCNAQFSGDLASNQYLFLFYVLVKADIVRVRSTRVSYLSRKSANLT